MAQAHHRLGAKVTVIEGLRALGKDDPELTNIVLEKIRSEGVDIREGTSRPLAIQEQPIVVAITQRQCVLVPAGIGLANRAWRLRDRRGSGSCRGRS